MFALATRSIFILSVMICIEPIISVQKLELIETIIQGLGSVVGVKDKSRWTKKEFYSFTGIKFAESPAGRLRFKAPVPVQPWTGTLNATKPGKLCPQTDVFKLDNTQNDEDLEDCLHLSVYTPTLNGLLPVLVYIHGGGWYEGGAARHPPHYYMEEDIVLVVPQYRLGALGFLSLQTEHIPGNVAFLDTILALEWVQKYIDNFGGDARRVTIAGQSAGALSVSLLMQSPLVNESLFHQAIMQSGSSLGTWIIDSFPRQNAKKIAAFGGCPADGSDEEITDCLQKISPKDLVDAYTMYEKNTSHVGMDELGGNRPTVGGPTNFLASTPLEILRYGKFRKIPVLAGVTQHEGSYYIANIYETLLKMDQNNCQSNLNIIDYLLNVLGVANSDVSGSLSGLNQYALFTSKALTQGNLLNLTSGLIDMAGIIMFRGPLFREMQIRAMANPFHNYLYSFNYVGEHTRFGYGADTSHLPFSGGVSHSNDNIYFFPWPQHVAQLNDEDAKMSRTMVKLWTSFVKNGRPILLNTTKWQPMKDIVGPFMRIDSPIKLGNNFLKEFVPV